MEAYIPRGALLLAALAGVTACADAVTAPQDEPPTTSESAPAPEIRVSHILSLTGEEARRKWAEITGDGIDPQGPRELGQNATPTPSTPAAALEAEPDDDLLRITRAETRVDIIKEGNVGSGLAQVWVVTETNLSALISVTSRVNLKIGGTVFPVSPFESPPRLASTVSLETFEIQGFHCNVEGGVTISAATQHEATAYQFFRANPVGSVGSPATCGSPIPPCEVSEGNDLDPYSTEFDPYAPDGSGSEECNSEEGTGGEGDSSGTQYSDGDTTTERVEWSTGIGTGDPTTCDLATVEWICIDTWDETTKTWKTWSCGYATVCS